MKLLSNFDSNIQDNLLQEYKESFGDDMVLAVNKSKFYKYTTVIFPIMMFFFAIIGATFLLRRYQITQWEILIPVLIIVLLTAIIVGYHVFWNYFNYKMDFLIVTPKEVIKYDQEGFFNRKSERLNANIIKSITVRKEGFIQSMFDIGTIVFLTELGNSTEGADGEIAMDVVDINDTDKKIRHILGSDLRERTIKL